MTAVLQLQVVIKIEKNYGKMNGAVQRFWGLPRPWWWGAMEMITFLFYNLRDGDLQNNGEIKVQVKIYKK